MLDINVLDINVLGINVFLTLSFFSLFKKKTLRCVSTEVSLPPYVLARNIYFHSSRKLA